jgi:hypothetical protein
VFQTLKKHPNSRMKSSSCKSLFNRDATLE